MKIFLLGGSRGLGKQILLQLLGNNYEVNCLVRNPNKLKINHKNLNLYKGDSTEIEDLRLAIKNSDYIINSLNVMRRNIIPWSRLSNSKTTISDSIKNIIELTQQKQIKHLVSVSAWGAGDSIKEIPMWFKYLIKFSNIKYPYKDHDRQEEIIKNSNLNWTIIRPAALINFLDHPVKESFSNKHKVNLIISRKSLSKYIVNILGNKDYFNKTITVSKK